MPLVIAVFLIVALYIISRETEGASTSQYNLTKKNMRRTNAYRERLMVDRFMKLGHPFDEAYDLSRKHIVSLGYDPCIPRDAYEENSSKIRHGRSIDTYDSWFVKDRREKFNEMRQKFASEDLYLSALEEYVYDNFPETIGQYNRALKADIFKLNVAPIGSFVMCPGYGVCEVMEHKFYWSGTSGSYVLQVCATGATIVVDMSNKDIVKC